MKQEKIRLLAKARIVTLLSLIVVGFHVYPSTAQSFSLDPRYIGVWENVIPYQESRIRFVYTITSNGYYTFVSESPDDTFTDNGTIDASKGKWTAHSDEKNETARGTYTFLDIDTLVTTTSKGNNSTWTRVKRQ